jgi:hypothetical protein
MNLKLWIGQRRFGTEFYVYSEEEDVMENLSKFLMITQGKSLIFTSDYCEDGWFINCNEYRGEKV